MTLVVVHDDLDLEPGRLRIRQARRRRRAQRHQICDRGAGNTAVRAAENRVGRPARGQDSADYVLKQVSTDEMAVLSIPVSNERSMRWSCCCNRDVATAMNQFNVRERELDEGDEGSS